jgi:G3E family GTPase
MSLCNDSLSKFQIASFLQVHLDGIVTLVDSVNIRRQLGDSGASFVSPRADFPIVERGGRHESMAQIAFADRILINKTVRFPNLSGAQAICYV